MVIKNIINTQIFPLIIVLISLVVRIRLMKSVSGKKVIAVSDREL